MAKNTHSEVNYSPVPGNLSRIVGKLININCYYENVSSGVKDLKPFRSFPYYCLAHLIDGDGYYYNPETSSLTELKPGDGILVAPGVEHQYGGYKQQFTEDSICFTGAAADSLQQAGMLKTRIVKIGRTRRLLPIITKLRNVSMISQFEAANSLIQLLIDIHRENLSVKTIDKQHYGLEKLLKELSSTPGHWWTVSEMAEFCNISENYLRRLFKKYTGLSPKEYIDAARINRASELLSSSDMKIMEIAEFLGYQDPYHFIRRFTKLTGCSPGRYRRQFSPRYQ